MLEPHPMLGAGKRGQPVRLDQHFGAGAQREQAPERDQGKQQEDRIWTNQ
jgi:hypothetical protein